MVRKRKETNLTIKESYDLFDQEKQAEGRDKESYLKELNYFLKQMELSEDDYISVVTEQLFNQFVIKMRETTLSDSSINHNLRSIKVYFNWCMNKGYLEPFKIKLLKVQEEKIKYCTDDEVDKLIRDVKTDDFSEMRTYTIICFILSTGARSSTIVNIKHEDLDFKNGLVTYRHLKTKQVVTIPMTKQLIRILQGYIHSWDTDSEYLFCDIKGGQLTTNALRHSMARYCKKRKMRVIYPHELRHTFARLFVKNGGDSLILQKFLCHSDLAMTKRYVRLFNNDLVNSGFEKYIPLNVISNNNSRTKTIRRCTK